MSLGDPYGLGSGAAYFQARSVPSPLLVEAHALTRTGVALWTSGWIVGFLISEKTRGRPFIGHSLP